jgi:hypothetical protein
VPGRRDPGRAFRPFHRQRPFHHPMLAGPSVQRPALAAATALAPGTAARGTGCSLPILVEIAGRFPRPAGSPGLTADESAGFVNFAELQCFLPMGRQAVQPRMLVTSGGTALGLPRRRQPVEGDDTCRMIARPTAMKTWCG